MSKSINKLVVILAIPVIRQGQVSGIIMGNVPLDKVTEMLKEVHYLDTRYGMVVDESGLLLADEAHPDLNGKINLLTSKIEKDLNLPQKELDPSLKELFQKAGQSTDQVKGSYQFLSEEQQIAICTPIQLPGNRRWTMVVTAPAHEFTHDVDSLGKTVLGISIFCLLLATLAICVIANKFTAPIIAMRDECLLLAEGDLRDRKIGTNSTDEIGQLAHGFVNMRKKLQKLVQKIYAQAEQLADTSEELTASAEQSSNSSAQAAESAATLAAASGKQTAASQETTVVVHEMSEGIQKISGNAQQLSTDSNQAATKADHGNQAVERAVNQMDQIRNTVSESGQVVTKLGEKSEEIGHIVDVIAGISGQTNLLALNAAIEAARAGEQGRGFAVVADEVRKLAEQSQNAAQQIAELIKTIQLDTEHAVAAMNAGIQEVTTGTDVVHAAGASFQEIIQVVNHLSEGVTHISADIERVAAGTHTIVNAADTMETLSRKSAGEAQHFSAASEEQRTSMKEISSASQFLAELAQELQSEVSKFKV